MNHKRMIRLLIGTAIFAALSLLYVIQGLSSRLDTIQAAYSVSESYRPERNRDFIDEAVPDLPAAVELNAVQNPEEILARIDGPADSVSFDGYIDCDINGDSILEQIIFFTGSNQNEGWDLAAYTMIEGISYQIWFQVAGSVKSVLPHTLADGRQALMVNCFGNTGDEIFWLIFEEYGFKVIPR